MSFTTQGKYSLWTSREYQKSFHLQFLLHFVHHYQRGRSSVSTVARPSSRSLFPRANGQELDSKYDGNTKATAAAWDAQKTVIEGVTKMVMAIVEERDLGRSRVEMFIPKLYKWN